MKKLKRPCSTCGRPIKLTWTVCPYCKAKQSPAEVPAENKAQAKAPRASRTKADAVTDEA